MPLYNSWRKCLITSYCTKPPSLDGSLDGSLDDNNYPDLAFVSLCNPRKPHYQILTIFTNCKCTILIFVIIFIYVHAEKNSLKISKLKSIARWIYFWEMCLIILPKQIWDFIWEDWWDCRKFIQCGYVVNLHCWNWAKIRNEAVVGVWSDLPKNLCLQGNLRKLLLNDITMLIYISTDMLHIFLHNNYISAK